MPNSNVDDMQNQRLVEVAKTQDRVLGELANLRERVAECSTEIALYRKILYAVGAVGASALGMNLSEYMM